MKKRKQIVRRPRKPLAKRRQLESTKLNDKLYNWSNETRRSCRTTIYVSSNATTSNNELYKQDSLWTKSTPKSSKSNSNENVAKKKRSDREDFRSNRERKNWRKSNRKLYLKKTLSVEVNRCSHRKDSRRREIFQSLNNRRTSRTLKNRLQKEQTNGKSKLFFLFSRSLFFFYFSSSRIEMFSSLFTLLRWTTIRLVWLNQKEKKFSRIFLFLSFGILFGETQNLFVFSHRPIIENPVTSENHLLPKIKSAFLFRFFRSIVKIREKSFN